MVGLGEARTTMRPRCGWRAALGLTLLVAAASSVVGGALAQSQAARAADVERVESYLNGLNTLQSAFVQINPDGGMATGDLYYARPDKMRLDYDPPNQILIVANGTFLVYHDRKLEQVTHLLPSSTPLGFLLDDEIQLSGDVTVTGLERVGDEILVTVVQTDEPDQGAVTLVFAEQPLELRRWTVVDAQGLRTHVMLEQLETGMSLDADLFDFCNPNSKIRDCE